MLVVPSILGLNIFIYGVAYMDMFLMISYISLHRNYYGSKIAMYFAWLGFYTQIFVVPSILGLIIFIYGVAYMDMFLMTSYISLLRNYYGSKIAMYFAWLGFYTQMLVVPSILGLIIFIYGVAYMDDSYPR